MRGADGFAVRVMVSCEGCGQLMVVAPEAVKRCERCERREMFLCGEAEGERKK